MKLGMVAPLPPPEMQGQAGGGRSNYLRDRNRAERKRNRWVPYNIATKGGAVGSRSGNGGVGVISYGGPGAPGGRPPVFVVPSAAMEVAHLMAARGQKLPGGVAGAKGESVTASSSAGAAGGALPKSRVTSASGRWLKRGRTGNRFKGGNPASASKNGHVGAAGGLGEEDDCVPRLRELRKRNRVNMRKQIPKWLKRQSLKSVPHAPRNTTSFIMRANKLGIYAPLTSPRTPAFIRTPIFSPAPWPTDSPGDKMLVEQAKKFKVDPYGSMNGCIRVRDPSVPELGAVGSGENRGGEELVLRDSSDEASSSSEAEDGQPSVAEPDSAELFEQRMDHDLRRFEMTFAGEAAGKDLEERMLRTRMEEQEGRIADLEEENMTLKEKLYLIEQEMQELRKRCTVVVSEDVLTAESGESGDEASASALACHKRV
ncbi:hypothetical protein CBR_g19975 [Chara braunii]|nr:hypothetical protein CBR_g19975 [Chara braunii]|eukprot:GBG75342.1 hypothetical protein CBR_g19975 [Chara braunii]